MAKHVTFMGAVWRLTDRDFKRLAKELRESGGTVENMDAYGRMVIDRLYHLNEVQQEAEQEEI